MQKDPPGGRVFLKAILREYWLREPDPTEIYHQAYQTRANLLGGYRDRLNKGV